MAKQSETALELGLINTLQSMNYNYVYIDRDFNLYANFKKQPENDKHDFVIVFHNIIKKHEEIKTYEDYSQNATDLDITEQRFMDFCSKSLDIRKNFTLDDDSSPKSQMNPNVPKVGDIDICPELFHSNIINVAYILEAIAKLNSYSEDFRQSTEKSLAQ